MALYLRLGHRLTKLGVRNGGALGRALVAGIHLEARKYGRDWDTIVPEGYDHTFPSAKDLPAPLPKGELIWEQRVKLAEKYNLRPEDYKPLQNLGDYPDLPYEGVAERDPWYDWDDARLRRNYGEPIHFDMDELDLMSPLDRKPEIVDWGQMVRWWGLVIAAFVAMYYIGEYFPHFLPIAPKQYPEWWSRDDHNSGNLAFPGEYKKLGREEVVHYDFKSYAYKKL